MKSPTDAYIENDVLVFFPSGQFDFQRSKELIQQIMHLSEDDLHRLSLDQHLNSRVNEQTIDPLTLLVTQLAKLANMIAEYFSGDLYKVERWFTLPNYNFGNASPRDMIRFGRYDKLLNFVLDARETEQPPDNEAL